MRRNLAQVKTPIGNCILTRENQTNANTGNQPVARVTGLTRGFEGGDRSSRLVDLGHYVSESPAGRTLTGRKIVLTLAITDVAMNSAAISRPCYSTRRLEN